MRRVALVLVGLILLAAGIAKIAALSGPVDTLGWPRGMIVAGSAVELLLGAWLLSGAAIRLAHLATIGIFLLFAVLSAYQVVRGVPSCGCLGKLYVHPAWMLGFDLLTLGVLAVAFPRYVASPAGKLTLERMRDADATQNALRSRFPRGALLGASFGFITIAGLAFSAWTAFGSVTSVLGLSSVASVLISPTTIDLGHASVGDTKSGTVRISNSSSVPVRIVGSQSDCRCFVASALPVIVPPNESVDLSVGVRVRFEGDSHVAYELFSDHESSRTLIGWIRIHGIEQAASE